MPGDLITRYLDELAERLPRTGRAALVAEIAGGLEDAVEHHRSTGLSEVDAQRAAIEEFGAPEAIADEYTPVAATTQAHRYGLAFMTTGPLIGGLWVTAIALTAELPAFTRIIGALLLALVLVAAPCAVFSVVATSGPLRIRVRSVVTVVSVTACTAIIVDFTAIAVLTTLLATTSGVALVPAVIAAVASATRLVLAARGALALRGTRAALA